MDKAHVKLPLLAAALAASCALVTDFDGYDFATTGQAGAAGSAGSSCVPPLSSCDGECIDLAANGAHCGACGHDCFGAGCENGQCEPEELANELGPIRRMAIDDTHVYFVNGGDTCDTAPACTVNRFPKSGGAVEPMASGVYLPTGIALDATHVYLSAYTPGGGDGVRRVPKAGGPHETIDDCNTAVSVAVDNDFVFFVTASCGGAFGLHRSDKADPTQEVQINDDTPGGYPGGTSGHLALGSDDVFWVNNAALMSAPKTLTSATELVPAPAPGRGIVRDDDSLWVVFGPDLYVVSEDGTSSEPFATMQFMNPPMYSLYIGLATDSTHVYWPSDVPDPMNGTIVKRAKTPSDAAPVVIARGQFGPFTVAVDATHAYWVNANGTIWRVAL